MPGLGFFEGCQIGAAWIFAAGGCLEEKESEGEDMDNRNVGCFPACSSALSLGGGKSEAAVQPTIHGVKGVFHRGEVWSTGK